MSDELTALDRLPATELRERAVALARRRWDVAFFWRLLQSLPAAEAAAGNLEASEAGVAQASGLFYDALGADDDPRVQEALRPIYVDYLTEHADAAEARTDRTDPAGPTTPPDGTGGA
jgi:hypothetical protein